MDKVRDILLYFIAAIAAFSVMCSVYQAMNRQLQSATLLAGLFVACTLLVFLPQLEVFKAWGVEARLRSTLDRAEEIIGRLRKLSTISARVTYLTMAWSNRWGEPPARTRMTLLDDINKQLDEIGVSTDERTNISRPLIRMVGVDLYNIYVHVFDRYMTYSATELKRRFEEPGVREAYTKLVEAQSDWRRRSLNQGPYFNIENYDFASELEKASPIAALESKDHAALDAFKKELIGLFAACEKKGGYTPEYANFYDRYSVSAGPALKIRELFGVDVNELK
jgi:hypothetical protein